MHASAGAVAAAAIKGLRSDVSTVGPRMRLRPEGELEVGLSRRRDGLTLPVPADVATETTLVLGGNLA